MRQDKPVFARHRSWSQWFFLTLALALPSPTAHGYTTPEVLHGKRRYEFALHSAKPGVESEQLSIDSAAAASRLRELGVAIRDARKNKSLVGERIRRLQGFLNCGLDVGEPRLLQESLSRSLSQAIAASADVGDYRRIRNLVDAAILFSAGQQILSPRVFSEALRGLCKTSVNVSKIKAIWKLAIESKELLCEPLGTRELNAMLRALRMRGKVQSAMTLFNSTDIAGDAYSLVELIKNLAESINQMPPKSSKRIKAASCWQVEEAMRLLRESPGECLNNYVFAAALQLINRATEQKGHNGAASALEILNYMEVNNFDPDVTVCTMVLSSLGKSRRWQEALSLLDAMERTEGWNTLTLPQPNEHSYATVIAACAQANRFEEALSLLSRLPERITPNTWMFNAALSACISKRTCSADKHRAAVSILEQMTAVEHQTDGVTAAPDSVTYTTAFAVMEGMDLVMQGLVGRFLADQVGQEKMSSDEVVRAMLTQMELKNITREPSTYVNAMKVARNGDVIMHIIKEARGKQKTSARGRQVNNLDVVFCAGLEMLAQEGDLTSIAALSEMMRHDGIAMNSRSLSHLVVALSERGGEGAVKVLVEAISGDQRAHEELVETYGIHITIPQDSGTWEELFADIVPFLLRGGEIELASSVVSLINKNGRSLNQSTLHKIALAYTHLALQTASQEAGFLRWRKNRSSVGTKVEMPLRSSVRARTAHEMLRQLEDPPPELLACVCKAFFAAGLDQEGLELLRALHCQIKAEQGDHTPSRLETSLVPQLHREMLKIMASRGNVTSALHVVREINDLAHQSDDGRLATHQEGRHVEQVAASRSKTSIGMKGEDWKLLLIAASKSGHWKLCVQVLQYIRPHLQATAVASDHADREYNRLERAITAAVLCFESRSQYGWSVRAISDWIDWSGRRPTKEAAVSCIRILAARGRGAEVVSLVHQVLQVSYHAGATITQEVYDKSLFVAAITHLHKHGLYDDADELYLGALSRVFVPAITTSRAGTSEVNQLDLHGVNVALAHSAVRIALQQDLLQSADGDVHDLVIITGRGWRSRSPMSPVVRPEIQRMLTEEFFPPLSSSSLPGNIGAIQVPADDVAAWVQHQRQQKGARMLAVANAIKAVSNVGLKRSIALSLMQKDDTVLPDGSQA